MAPVATASLAETPQPHVGVNRPNMVQVGTIVWLSSELMFFAALFAMYFTIRSVAARSSGPRETAKLNVPFSAVNTLDPGAVAPSDVPDGRVRGRAVPAATRRPWWKIWTRSTGCGLGHARVARLTYIVGAFFIGGQIYEYTEPRQRGH